MVFKKPYAFFIKYFRVINFILTFLLSIILYNLNELRVVLTDVYRGDISNFSNLGYNHIGFKAYFFVFLTILILLIITILLRKKKKPLTDYGFAILYAICIIIFYVVVADLFYTLENFTVEPANLKIYSDISSLIMLPIVYFIFRFFLITIGFNLKKFDFTKDLIELKSEIEDDEEIELVLNKDIYKYKRGIRRYIRELKYYILENKIVLFIIFILSIGVLFTFVGIKKYDTNEYKVNQSFNAGGFTYTVNRVYETKYNYNHNIIKKDAKFVIALVNVRNNLTTNSSIDFKRIRLMYGKEFVYSNNYYNNYFIDLGEPYNSQLILSGEEKNYLFIFKVPLSFESNDYYLKFYDRNIVENEELKAGYKSVKINPEKIDSDIKDVFVKFNEKVLLDQKEYGTSFIKVTKSSLLHQYEYLEDGISKIILPSDINQVLLIINYELELDKNNLISPIIEKEKDFFDNYAKIRYKTNDEYRNINNLNIIKSNLDGKLFISVPYNLLDAKNVQFIINFRNYRIIYSL